MRRDRAKAAPEPEERLQVLASEAASGLAEAPVAPVALGQAEAALGRAEAALEQAGAEAAPAAERQPALGVAAEQPPPGQAADAVRGARLAPVQAEDRVLARKAPEGAAAMAVDVPSAVEEPRTAAVAASSVVVAIPIVGKASGGATRDAASSAAKASVEVPASVLFRPTAARSSGTASAAAAASSRGQTPAD